MVGPCDTLKTELHILNEWIIYELYIHKDDMLKKHLGIMFIKCFYYLMYSLLKF